MENPRNKLAKYGQVPSTPLNRIYIPTRANPEIIEPKTLVKTNAE